MKERGIRVLTKINNGSYCCRGKLRQKKPRGGNGGHVYHIRRPGYSVRQDTDRTRLIG